MRPASAAACRVCVCFQTTPPHRRLRASALLAPTRSPSSSFPPSCGEAAARGWLPPPPKGSAPRLLRFGGSRVRCSAMFSRISRIGVRLLCEARAERRTGNLPSSGGSLYQAHASRYSTLMVSPTVLSLRDRLFSTATSSGDQDESRQEEEKITVTFVNKDSEQTISVPVGMSMLEAAHENDIELEGACEGSLACSTCHVIVMDVNYYNKLEDPTDEENDMLDLAFRLTETSRLGCQVIARPELDGMRLALPAATRNFAVDGYVPKPH